MSFLNRKWGRRIAVVWLIVVALLLFAFFIITEIQKSIDSKKPNVILISIDALRADHLGCYGYPKPTSPNIDAFAAKNILFENAYTTEPWTLPTHLSMLTSLFTETHNVRKPDAVLSKHWQTLPEILKQKGYVTGGFATNPYWMNGRYGFARGFDHYFAQEKRGSGLNQNIVNFVKKNSQKPLFLFIHYFDVHSAPDSLDFLPYYAPELFRRLFRPRRPMTFTGGNGILWASSYLAHCEGNGIKLTSEQKEELNALYDASVRFADNNLAYLFNALKKEGIFKNALIILTADHGEELQDHGHYMHFQIYEEVFHIPLIIKIPQEPDKPYLRFKSPQKITGLVTLVDLMPTVLDYLQIPYPPNQIQGQSLLPLIEGKDSAHDYVCALETEQDQTRLAIRHGPWKLLCMAEGDPRYELYNLRDDPLESRNLSKERPDIVAQLRNALREWRDRNHEARISSKEQEESKGLSPEDKKKLRSLGYITE
jgi:arylsulfatase A-like enzyme